MFHPTKNKRFLIYNIKLYLISISETYLNIQKSLLDLKTKRIKYHCYKETKNRHENLKLISISDTFYFKARFRYNG